MSVIENRIVKVIIAEDHLLFADGVEQILASLPGFEVIAKVSNGKLLMQTLNSLSPDLLLLDINMPYMDGLEATKILKRNLPGVKIVFLSMYCDKKIIEFAKSYSVNGFIMKTVMASDLKDALIKISNGEQIFILPEQLKDSGIRHANDSFSKKFKLSSREIEIIALLKEGHSTRQISEVLFLSFYTVETHRKNILKKLDVKNTAELIAFTEKNWDNSYN